MGISWYRDVLGGAYETRSVRVSWYVNQFQQPKQLDLVDVNYCWLELSGCP